MSHVGTRPNFKLYLPFVLCCRVLAELGEEMNAQAPVIAKQKKESEFLKQKAGHYQKLVSSMTVGYCSPTSIANVVTYHHFIHRRS